MLHTLTEILQIEENISETISRQSLTYARRGSVAVHFLPESHAIPREVLVNLFTYLQY